MAFFDFFFAFLDWLFGSFEWQSIIPEMVVLLFALLSPLMGAWNTDRLGMQQFALLGLGGAFLMTLGSLFGWRFDIPFTRFDFNLQYVGSQLHGAYAITEASQMFKLLFLAVAALAVIGLGRPLKGRAAEDYGEFHGLLLFATLGMMVVASATELITLLLGIETASMSSYLMAAFRRDQHGAEASLKYFVIGAIASGMTLFGISLVYGMAGTTHIPALAQALFVDGAFDAMATIALVLVFAGLAFKISSFPFHTWTPDVYCGGPIPLAGVLASASKAMGFVALFNVFLVGLIDVKEHWELAIALLAAITMTLGNLIALQQTSIRRMLAYSSIAQAGYVMIAVAVGTWYALGGGILHLFVNAAMKLGAFLVIGGLVYLGIPDHLDGYKGLGKRAPFLAFAMTIFLLSMAGLPPFGGFVSKFVLFSGAVDAGTTAGQGWLVWLALLAVLNSAISLFYYLRVIRKMYVEEGTDTQRLPMPTGAMVAVGVCLAGVLVMGFHPDPFIDAAMTAARSMAPNLVP